MTKYTLPMTLRSPAGKMVGGVIKIDDGIAVSAFDDKNLARQLVDAEKRAGNKNINWNRSNNAMIERFPNMNAEKILEKYIFSGLARSGKITRGKEILDLDLGGSFRKAKSTSLKGFVVQKNPLQFGSETREIQMFKKRKGRKNILK